MKINQIKVFMPASVEVELKDGNTHDIFVMVHLPTQTVLIPEDKDVALLADDADVFRAGIWKKFAEINQVKPTTISLPQEEWDAVGDIIGNSKQMVERAIKKARS